MKIIQTFAKFDELNPYLKSDKRNKNYYYLNYYSFLLSYATLKKYYGSVTKICNQGAYDTLVKYVPYDEVVIRENQNDIVMWNKYKLDMMKIIGEDFIHVDSDVFIFDDFYRNFINGKYDVLVQDVISRKMNTVAKGFVFENKDFFADTKIFTKSYDGQSFSCGTVGLTKKVQEYYFAGIDVFYDAIMKVGPENILWVNLLLEETLLYLIIKENNFTYDYIIPQKLVDKHNIMWAGDKIGYVHVWAMNKYRKKIVRQIRTKLIREFPEYLDHLLKFERDVFSKMDLYKYFIVND
jgi:hypothetical protein